MLQINQCQIYLFGNINAKSLKDNGIEKPSTFHLIEAKMELKNEANRRFY